MPNHAPSGGPGYAVMAGDMSGDTADDGSFDTAFRIRGLRANQERHSKQRCGQHLQSGGWVPRHTIGS